MIPVEFLLFLPVAALAFWKPWLGIVGLVLLQVLLARGTEGTTAAEGGFMLLFLATLCGWALRGLVSGRFGLPRTRLAGAIALFVGCCMLTGIVAYSAGIPMLDWLRGWYRFAILLLVLPIATEFDSPRRLRVLVGALLVASSCAAVIGILNIVSSGALVRYAASGLPSTIHVWGSIILIALFVHVRTLRWRIVLVGMLGINLFRTIADVSRLSIGSILIGLGVMAWLWVILKSERRHIAVWYVMKRVLVLVCVGLLLAIVSPGFLTQIVDPLRSRLSVTSVLRGLESRDARVSVALKEWRESPLVGRGFGGDAIANQLGGSAEGEVGPVHSLYVSLLVNSGMVGLALYLSVLWWLVREGMRSLRRAQRGFEHGAVLGLLAAVVGFLFFAMLSIRGARIEAQLLLAVAGGARPQGSRQELRGGWQSQFGARARLGANQSVRKGDGTNGAQSLAEAGSDGAGCCRCRHSPGDYQDESNHSRPGKTRTAALRPAHRTALLLRDGSEVLRRSRSGRTCTPSSAV